MKNELDNFKSKVLRKREVEQNFENAVKSKIHESIFNKEVTNREKKYRDKFNVYKDIIRFGEIDSMVEEFMEHNKEVIIQARKNEDSE